MLITDKGKIFGWGNTEYGQIPAVTDCQQVNIATELKMCESLGKIVDIASGGSFCMILNSTYLLLYIILLQILDQIYFSRSPGEGNVYVWGFGILGLGPEAQRILKPTIIPKTLFGVNVYEPETKVRSQRTKVTHSTMF